MQKVFHGQTKMLMWPQITAFKFANHSLELLKNLPMNICEMWKGYQPAIRLKKSTD